MLPLQDPPGRVHLVDGRDSIEGLVVRRTFHLALEMHWGKQATTIARLQVQSRWKDAPLAPHV